MQSTFLDDSIKVEHARDYGHIHLSEVRLQCKIPHRPEVGVGTVWFRAVLSETETEIDFFCGSVWCGFEAKIEMKPNR